MGFRLVLRRRKPPRQKVFPYVERVRRLERRFKWIIGAATGLAIVTIIGVSPSGRFAVRSYSARAVRAAEEAIGVPPDRAAIAEALRVKRTHDVNMTAGALRRAYEQAGPDVQRLMDFAGMAPDNALLRWGNIDRILLLPSTVFAPDNSGRSYRLRPTKRAVWVRNISLKQGVLAFFLVPDGPGLAEAVAGSGGVIVPGATQTTNSWGCRGPEPDRNAPLRGIVIGDSFMQGLFIGDDETPPAQLERELARRLKTRVSILNTGHLGYSPEQYYYTLREYIDQFRPHFVVVSVFANDFGDTPAVVERGKGDWGEAKYWFDELFQLCRSRELVMLTVPIPTERQVTGRRHAGFYPGRYSSLASVTAVQYCDPTEDLVNENLARVADLLQRKEFHGHSPLFNGHIADGHFSPLGSEVWARAVGRRLEALLERSRDHRGLQF